MPEKILVYLSKEKQYFYSDKLFLKGLVYCAFSDYSSLETSLNKVFGSRTRAVPSEIILLTDTEEAACLSPLFNIPVLGISFDDSFFSNCTYVCSDPMSIDSDYISLVYNRFYKIPVTICESSRLIIRELSHKDLPLLSEKIIHTPELNSVQESYTQILERYKYYIETSYPFYDYGLWGVFLKTDNTLIGHAGIQNCTIGENTCIELGYMIFPEYQHKGYAFEATGAVLDYAFNKLELTEIYARISPDNLPSIKLAKKLGLKYVNPAGNEDCFVITRPDYKV